MQVAYDKRRAAYEKAVADAQKWHEQALSGGPSAERTTQSPSSKPSTPHSGASDAAGAPHHASSHQIHVPAYKTVP